jgi:1,2-diacylglycerol 3-alpha-glucosyltransferase
MTQPLFVSDVYFPRVNGVSTSIRSFRDDLAGLGVESRLIAPDYGTDHGARDGADDGGESGVLRVRARVVPFDVEDRIMVARPLRATLRSAAVAECDLVHIQTPFRAHYAGLAYARERGLPVVATCHTYFEDYLHHYLPLLPRAIGGALARAVMARQLNAVDGVISPSAQVRDKLLEYGVTRPIEVIPTGMTADRFVPGDGARFRREHGIEQGTPMLLTLGRVAHEKNLGFLLQMFARLQARLPAALFVIAGEGPARAALEREAQTLGVRTLVRFVGNLDRYRGLSDCYAAADVFVFASRTETQGLVLLEAMAQSRPVVSTACLGTRSVLMPASGACVVPESHAEFVDAVLSVLADNARARALGEQGRQWAQRWSSREMARRMAGFYASLPTVRDLASTPAVP